MKPRIVLSGVNFVEAGPLSIFQDALEALAQHFLDRYEVVALVHSKPLFVTTGITYLEFPTIKSSWLRRLRFEYWDCRAISRELKPHLWLAMHDVTPSVEAGIRAVYCHNPAPFYKPSLRELAVEWKVALFSVFYRYLYGYQIAQNNFVVVQQQWMRNEFRSRYSVREVIVAHPSIPSIVHSSTSQRATEQVTIFFFPAYPRTFKNVEVLLSAAELLEQRGCPAFEIWLTIQGNENRYAASLHKRFAALASVRWLGAQSRSAVQELYERTDCLVFPSRLETWGMPISEFKQTGKSMLVADLPYAHETVGDYTNADFFAETDAESLADKMRGVMHGAFTPQARAATEVQPPFAEDWQQLFELLLGNRANDDAAPEGA